MCAYENVLSAAFILQKAMRSQLAGFKKVMMALAMSPSDTAASTPASKKEA